MSLEKLITKNYVELYNGVEIEIKKIRVCHLPLILNLVNEEDFNKDIKKVVMNLVKNKFEESKKLIVSLTNIPLEILEEVSLDVIIFVLSKIILRNAEFVKKNILPLLTEMKTTIEAMTQDGKKLSNS